MIINGLLTVILRLLQLLLTPIDIPDLPPEVASIFSTALGYLQSGLGIFAAFCHFNYIMTLFSAVVVIEAAMLVYKFIRWVLQKIPMASIE